MYNYLSSFPFNAGQGNSSDCECSGQAFDPAKFKLYSESDRLPTFSLRVLAMGENPDLTYANECVRVFTCDGKDMVKNITMEEAGIRLMKDTGTYFIIYDGGKIAGMKLDCGKCYRLKIMSYWSEPFWITDTPQSKIVIEFKNTSSQVGDVPYQAENFVQRIMVDGEICSMDAEIFENKKSDANGNETVTFQRMTMRKGLAIFNAPDFINQLIGSIKIIESYKVIHKARTYEPLAKRSTLESTKNGCCDYDINITMPLRESSFSGGKCQTDADGVLTEVEIPDDLPDSCEEDDDWTETGQTLCLEFGKVPELPPPTLPPVGTPPVGAPCPPNGTVVSNTTVTQSCDNPFESEGIKYKKKVTKLIADGACGTTEQIQYIEPCGAGGATHTVSNVNCGGGVTPTPPVGTPPVGTPPVGTPPVGTPPVGTPPVGTPPVGTPPPSGSAKYEFIMGTTGGGFDRNATHGIGQDWIDRIEAFNYSWGWGITGISLWIHWDNYEPTSGNFQTAALQRAISYCNARNLGLSVFWLGTRTEGDGFINDGERVKGSNGTIYLEGVPGFGKIYAGYGCDRVNALMVPAIQSVANTLKTYSKAFAMFLGGGHTGELINHIIVKDGVWECGDFSDDNLSRFNAWVAPRGLASPGTPPMIQGPGIPWPHPDFGDARGLEFARFTTYNIAKYYKNFCNAVKAVSSLPCIYVYAAADNLQLRSTANAAMDYIGQYGDGMYGSEGDGLYDHIAKIRVNSVNVGTFPNGISCVEFDPDDLSVYRYSYGTTPPYCQANPQYGQLKTSAEFLYSRGVRVIHTAMAYCPSEIVQMGSVLQPLWQTYIGKPFASPPINSGNRIQCEVTGPYRNSENILDHYGVNPNTQYARYTSADYWGGVPPEGTGGGTPPPSGTNPAIDNYLNSNLAAYQSNILFDVKKATQTPYSYTQGAYTRTSMMPVASLSKAVSAAVLLTLIDDGLLSLSTTVGSLISSWNSGAKAGITLKQIISHTAGIAPDTTEALDGSATLEAYVDAYASYALANTPGTVFAYSTHPYNIAGRMAEVVTGQTWKQLFESRIRNKCSMGDAIYNPKDPYQPISGNPNQPNVGHGLWITQQAYANFMGMIRDGGVYNGVQVISSTNLPLIWTDMTTGLGPWGFGMIMNDSGNEPTAESAKGCYAWVNRSKQYAGVLFTQAENAATIGPNNGLRDIVRANY